MTRVTARRVTNKRGKEGEKRREGGGGGRGHWRKEEGRRGEREGEGGGKGEEWGWWRGKEDGRREIERIEGWKEEEKGMGRRKMRDKEREGGNTKNRIDRRQEKKEIRNNNQGKTSE